MRVEESDGKEEGTFRIPELQEGCRSTTDITIANLSHAGTRVQVVEAVSDVSSRNVPLPRIDGVVLAVLAQPLA